MGSTRRDRKAAEPAAAEPATAGKRGAPAPAEDEPDAKAAKKAEPEPAAKDVAPDEAAPMDADQEGGDADAEGDEAAKGAPVRRSGRARNPVRKARDPPKKPDAQKIPSHTYVENELLAPHLKEVGNLLEVKIPAECCASTNQHVKSRQLWGTDAYTSDSDIVAVLAHLGYYLPGVSIPPTLLELRATIRATEPSETFPSTSRNGIRSRSWGALRDGNLGYEVESCKAMTVDGKAIELHADANRIPTPCPTFFPNTVESVVHTRSSRDNDERKKRMIQQVTIQYNLCNEPWLKYNIAAVADQGFKRSQWTSARLRKETLYLESHSTRYELSCETELDEEGVPVGMADGGEAPEDTYRWARCNAPLPLENVRALGVPLPTSELSDVQAGLTWDQIAFGLNFVEVKGVQTKVVRLQYLPKMEAD